MESFLPVLSVALLLAPSVAASDPAMAPADLQVGLALRQPPPPEAFVRDFRAEVGGGHCDGEWTLKPNDHHVAVRVLSPAHALLGPQAELATGPKEAVIELLGFFLSVFAVIPPPEPGYEVTWRYQCIVTSGELHAIGGGDVLRRVTVEALDRNAGQYREIGVPCEYDGVLLRECTAFFTITPETPIPGDVVTGKGERPKQGCLSFDPDGLRAVNAAQHRALAELGLGSRRVINAEPILECFPGVAVAWTYVNELSA
jgi:hypothetical protein